ncbi:hypothetical protein SS50377_27928 [Spironucleus salmonicida]|uniref:Uncharacterized protein n=1 Tax=Spironucleus salmonicida TaxID=348837 RepID=V6LDA7_9EUKA|nr:hypothetical protein SS50377_27928 [Spironucleus salmonicida]|eukprot:EST42490.1 Hypothetical protein SS50377_17796 [Spironucleus salmonicida]
MTLADSPLIEVFKHENIPLRSPIIQSKQLEWINNTRNTWKDQASILIGKERMRVDMQHHVRNDVLKVRRNIIVDKQFRQFRNRQTSFNLVDYFGDTNDKVEENIYDHQEKPKVETINPIKVYSVQYRQ